MGIVHFASVGTSPGAVTSALAYFQRHPEEQGSYPGTIVQDVMVFCSPEVESGKRPADDDLVWNEYGQTHPRKGWQAPRRRQGVIEVIRDFLVQEQVLTDHGHLYVWPVEVENFEVCFDAIARATLALGRAEGTGHYIWANLTGGTNILNAALLEVTFLSGLIGRLYYTFLGQPENRKYLLPSSTARDQFALDWVRTTKTQFDENYYRVLMALATLHGWCEDESLLSLLAQDEYCLVPEQRYFAHMPVQSFRTQLLNRMDGREIEREEEDGCKLHRVRLAHEGQAVLTRIASPLFQAIVKRGQGVETDLVQECRGELGEKKYL